jgi:hypothetical protein
MSLPRSHVESLESHVLVHEERLKLLREQLKNTAEESDPNPKGDPNPKPPLPSRVDNYRRLLEREILFHNQLVELARDPKVLKVLSDLTKDSDFRRWAASDPVGVAQKLSIKVPAGVKLRIEGTALGNVRMQVLSHEGLYPFLVSWDSELGFSPVREPTVSNKR